MGIKNQVIFKNIIARLKKLSYWLKHRSFHLVVVSQKVSGGIIKGVTTGLLNELAVETSACTAEGTRSLLLDFQVEQKDVDCANITLQFWSLKAEVGRYEITIGGRDDVCFAICGCFGYKLGRSWSHLMLTKELKFH